MSLISFFTAGMLAAVTPQAAPEALASDAFNRLAAQEGNWVGDRGVGKKPIVVSIRKIAGGSAIVETWYPGTEREALTIYHRDGPMLVADHYCPQGNVPRLVLAGTSTAGRLEFLRLGGTNLDVAGFYHEERFTIWLKSDSSYDRSERYEENLARDGDDPVEPDEVISFRRTTT